MDKLWSVLFGLVALFALGLFLIAPAMGWWLPPYVSSFGGEIDNLFYVILWVTAFFFVLTEGLLVWNMWRAATVPHPPKSPFVHGNHKLELAWTIVPGALLVLLAVVQIGAWAQIKFESRMPKPDGTVQQLVVSARQWEWRIRYPGPAEMRRWEQDPRAAEAYWRAAMYPYEDEKQYDEVHVVNELHCWKGNKVLVHLKTRDVLHSMFIPILRLKQDAVPGKSIQVWFDATDFNTKKNPKTGLWEDGYDPKTDTFLSDLPEAEQIKRRNEKRDRVWELACAEYCGTRHSMMKGHFYVHETRDDFLAWLEWAQQQQQQRQP